MPKIRHLEVEKGTNLGKNYVNFEVILVRGN